MTKKTIRTAIVGVGNCASALVQGVDAYTACEIPNTGLMFDKIGGYGTEHIQFVAAFDIDSRKVGKPLRKAILEKPNCCFTIYETGDFTRTPGDDDWDPIVEYGPTLDGVADHMWTQDIDDDERFYMPAGPTATVAPDVKFFANRLRELNVDVLLNYLPVGSELATRFWAEVCLEAKVNMVNCIPVFIASDKEWARRFVDAGVTIIGDDIRSQIGASIISATLQELFLQRGAEITVHYQDNIGGNSDFLNMQSLQRLSSKKISKENVIRRQNELAGVETKENSIAAGPAKYFPALGDNKRAHWLIKGTVFGGAPFEFTADLSCQDSPNSAGVVIDAIRLVTVANELGIVGPVIGPSAATQKTPSVDMGVRQAYEECKHLAERKLPAGYREHEDLKVMSTFVHEWVYS